MFPFSFVACARVNIAHQTYVCCVNVPGVVVGAGTQDVTQRMPCQAPDHPFMSHLHPSNLLLHPDTNTVSQSDQYWTNTTFALLGCPYPACQKSREPSEPPLANRPSCTGCQATAENTRTAFHHISEPPSCFNFPALTLTCRLLLVSSEHLQLLLQVPDVKQLAQVVT